MEISIDGLRFERDHRVVLDIPQLAIAAATTTAIFGPNGSGKTTLLRLIAGLEQPLAGTIRLGGAAMLQERRMRSQIAYAFQEAVFLRGTVHENLALGLQLRGVPEPEQQARVREVANECGIAHLLDRSARRLSGGEAQRVNLARALALRAPVTLLDEPLASLDRATRIRLLDELPRLLGTFTATAVVVTHDREEAFRLADQLVVLIDGRVRAAGPKASVYQCPPDRDTAELLGYTVIVAERRTSAIPPGGLRLGAGETSYELLVQRIVDMGNHLHAVGTVNGQPVDVRLDSTEVPPAVGARVVVSARSSVQLSNS